MKDIIRKQNRSEKMSNKYEKAEDILAHEGEEI